MLPEAFDCANAAGVTATASAAALNASCSARTRTVCFNMVFLGCIRRGLGRTGCFKRCAAENGRRRASTIFHMHIHEKKHGTTKENWSSTERSAVHRKTP